MAHLLIAWELRAEDVGRRNQLRKLLREQLDGYSWVRALRDVYIVNVGSVEDRLTLRTRLADVAKREGNIHFIVTPLMVGGRYNGWLPRERWPKIRKRTDDS